MTLPELIRAGDAEREAFRERLRSRLEAAGTYVMAVELPHRDSRWAEENPATPCLAQVQYRTSTGVHLALEQVGPTWAAIEDVLYYGVLMCVGEQR